MNLDTKYRAWNAKEKQMTHMDVESVGYYDSKNFPDYVLMQHIQLQDKKDKDIYRDDILLIEIEIPNKNTEEGLLMIEILGKRGLSALKEKQELYSGKWQIVSWGYKFMLCSLKAKKRRIGKSKKFFSNERVLCDLGNLAQNELKIVGNIHENPELLK